MQVRKTQVRICNGGKRKYSNLKSSLKSLRFSSLAFSVDLLSVGLDLLTADRLKMQDWKIVNFSKYSLSCCTYVFHRCRFVLAFSVLAYSILRYFRFP